MNRFKDINHTHGIWLSGLRAFLLLLLLPLTGNAATSAQDLIDKTQSFLEQQIELYQATSDISGRYQINIGRLDNRLRLGSCTQELEARLEHNKPPVGRVTVRISCDDDSPWSIFVPASVNLFREVVVIARPVKRNTLLQENDLVLAERDLASLSQGYFTELKQVSGSEARRAMQVDQVVTPGQIQAPAMVKRGDHVVITAISGNIRVRMPGEALADGSLGQQIRVRNTRSQRIVHARVTAPGHVEVAM